MIQLRYVNFYLTCLLGYLSLALGRSLDHSTDLIKGSDKQAHRHIEVHGVQITPNTDTHAHDRTHSFLIAVAFKAINSHVHDATSHVFIRALNYDESTHNSIFHYGKMTFTAISLVALIIVSSLLATRLKTLGLSSYVAINMIRVLTVIVYLVTICFVLSASILMAGWKFTTHSVCKAAIDVCLVFYLGHKTVVNLFLVERLHQLRAHRIARHKDVLVYTSVAAVLGGFATLAALTFVDPVASVSDTDSKCRIGLQIKSTIPLLVYNITINFSISAVFWRLNIRNIRAQSWNKMFEALKSSIPFHKMTIFPSSENLLLVMVVKSTVGAVGIIVPTIVNMGLLVMTHGHELSWLCYTICTLDVTWSTLVVHWLTAKTPEPEHTLARHTVMLPDGTIQIQPVFASTQDRYHGMP